MKRIKDIKRRRKIKHTILCLLATVIPYGVFLSIQLLFYPNVVLSKIYEAIGIFAVVTGVFLLSEWLCKKIDRRYCIGEKKVKENDKC